MFTFAAQPVLTGPQWRKKNGTVRQPKQSLPSARGVPQRKQCRPPNIVAGAGRWHTARSAVLSSRWGGQTLSGQSPPAFWNHRLTSILLGSSKSSSRGRPAGCHSVLGGRLPRSLVAPAGQPADQLIPHYHIFYIVS